MDCVTATKDSYPFPTDVPLPTHQARELDPKDPRGLGYCYHGGSYTPIDDESFWSLFSDDILDTVRNESNCKQEASAWAPVIIAQQATFLLDTTTDFIDEPETKSPQPSPSTKASSTPTEVLVDPFQVTSQSGDEQKLSQSESSTKLSLIVVSTSPTIAVSVTTESSPDRTTTSGMKQSLEASVSPSDQSSPPSQDDNEAPSSDSRGAKATASADEVSKSQISRPTASDNDIPDSSAQSALFQPAATPKTSQLEVLNSLIQDVGQQQSSVGLSASTGERPPTLTLEGVTATPDALSGYVLGEQTLRAGEPAITVSGTKISLASDASAIVVDSSTRVLLAFESAGARGPADSPAPFLTLTANSNSASEFVVGGQTIKPGGSVITLSGTPISLESQATAVVVGSRTRPVATVSFGKDQTQQPGVQSAVDPVPQLTLAGATATLNSASEYMIADQTLKAGGSVIIVSGTPISLASQATAIVVGSSTSILGTASQDGTQAQQTGKLASELTLAGKTATLNSVSEYVIEDQTLTPGEGAITLSGTRISLAPDATAVVIGSTTSALAATSSGIGDYVWAGLAGVLEAAETGSSASSRASETESRSEVVVTSTASDGGIIVETSLTTEHTMSSPTDFSGSSADTSLLVSGESSSTSSSSSAKSSDVASDAVSARVIADVTALVFWIGLILMCEIGGR